jgi:Skp family chaperone for outer membrane proteins
MLIKSLIPAAFAVMFLALPAIAQEVVRVAVCNPSRVLDLIDERKAIESQVNQQREMLRVDGLRRKGSIEELQRQMKDVNPNSDLFKEKNEQLMKQAIEFDVWARLTEQSLQRAEKELIKSLYEKIREAVREVAETRKIDLVLTERRPDLSPDRIEGMKPQEVSAAILNTDVLYSNPKADITNDVVLLLNKKFAVGDKK